MVIKLYLIWKNKVIKLEVWKLVFKFYFFIIKFYGILGNLNFFRFIYVVVKRIYFSFYDSCLDDKYKYLYLFWK